MADLQNFHVKEVANVYEYKLYFLHTYPCHHALLGFETFLYLALCAVNFVAAGSFGTSAAVDVVAAILLADVVVGNDTLH